MVQGTSIDRDIIWSHSWIINRYKDIKNPAARNRNLNASHSIFIAVPHRQIVKKCRNSIQFN
jgi:hypothetical protein